MVPAVEDRSLGSLISDLASELSALVRQELALVKIELGDNVAHIGQDIAMLAVGGAVLYAGFLAFVATLIVGIGLAIGSLLAGAAIVTIIVLASGYFVVRRSLDNLKHHQLATRQSIESLNLNVTWVKEQFR
jgi:hypothetical protein